jgi:hypothetical protein
MKRLSRHTVVVLLIALLSSVAGLTLAVVAFGQGGGTPTVPTSAYTTTTDTTALSPYATTPSTTPASTTPATTTTTPTKTSTTEATTTNGNNPEREHGKSKPRVPVANSGPPPSRATRKGPSHLAFTGGEPIYVGFFGAALMAGGLMLHRRRRAATDR